MKTHYVSLILIVILLIGQAFYNLNKKKTYRQKSAFLMGTPVTIKVVGADPEVGLAEIRRLEQLFSCFLPESDIYKINHQIKVQLSPETKACLALAEKMKQLTSGAFDVRFPKGIEIDLGGIAKGYAVEKAKEALVKSGAKNGIIDMRSSIVVFGRRSSKTGLGQGWKVGVQDPRSHDRKIASLLGVVELRGDQALSTSGNYERGQHIVDPKSGQPAYECVGVTLIGQNAAELDALSTAVFVLGPRKGLALIESLPEVEGLIIDVVGQKLFSTGFVLK